MSIYEENIITYKHFSVPYTIVDKFPKFGEFMKSIDEEFDQISDFLDDFIRLYNPLETSPEFLNYLAKEFNFEFDDELISTEIKRVTLTHVTDWFKRRSTNWFFDYLLNELKVDATITYGRDRIGILSNSGELSTPTFTFTDSKFIADGTIYVEIDSVIAKEIVSKFNENKPIGRAFFFTLQDKFKIVYDYIIQLGSNGTEVINLFGSEWSNPDFFGTIGSNEKLSDDFTIGHNEELWEQYSYVYDISFLTT